MGGAQRKKKICHRMAALAELSDRLGWDIPVSMLKNMDHMGHRENEVITIIVAGSNSPPAPWGYHE